MYWTYYKVTPITDIVLFKRNINETSIEENRLLFFQFEKIQMFQQQLKKYCQEVM